MKNRIENILSLKVGYYQKLSSEFKKKFFERVNLFIETKEFIGRHELILSDEMKVLVAASAIQLSFGLGDYNFPHFSKIFIFPQSYFNSLTQKEHKGDVNFAGIIALSWKDLKEGFDKPNDNYNLGLHEFAHALLYDIVKKNTINDFFEHYYPKWRLVAEEEYKRIKKNEDTYFRKYAGTDRMEFFAVCIEYFFESSEEMKKRLPTLYFHTCELLNQDPAKNIILR